MKHVTKSNRILRFRRRLERLPFSARAIVGGLPLCLGLVLLVGVSVSAAGESGKMSGQSNTLNGTENSCWKSHASKIQVEITPFAARRDTLSRQIALKKRALLMVAMEKQGITRTLTKSQSRGERPTKLQKVEEKAALEELRELESQIGKDPGLLELVEGLRMVDGAADSAVTEILKMDPVCANLEPAIGRGFASRANREYHMRMAESSQSPKRKAVMLRQLPGELK